MPVLPCSSGDKESARHAGDPGSIPGSGRSFGEGNGNPLQFLPGESHGQRSLADYSPWGCKESDMTEQLTPPPPPPLLLLLMDVTGQLKRVNEEQEVVIGRWLCLG